MTQQALRLIKPVEVTPARLTATNIAEPDATVGEAAWLVGTTYTIGQRVILTTTHKLYESVQNGNTGNSPDTSPTWWAEVSATNRYRMFDMVNSSQSTQASLIDVTITPGTVVNGLALLNVNAQTIRVRMIDPIDGTVFDQTYNMQAPPLFSTWWNYYFDPIELETALFVTLPSYGSAAIRIEASGPATVSIGTVIIGVIQPIGEGVEYGAKIGIRDYSRKERNDFGDLVLVERSFADRASFTMLVPNEQRNAVKKLLTSVRATPCLWIGVVGEEDTYVYGIFNEFEYTIQFVEHSVLTLDLEGLT